MHLTTSDKLLIMACLMFLFALFGCTVPNVDTNGYYSNTPREHLKYCQTTKGTIITFVPCSEIKHDITL